MTYGPWEYAFAFCRTHKTLVEEQTTVDKRGTHRCIFCNVQVRLSPTPSDVRHNRKVLERRREAKRLAAV